MRARSSALSPRPGAVRSPATARTRARYGDGSRHSLASVALQALLGRGAVGAAHERDHVAVALLEQADQHLHAEEAGRPR